MPTNLDAWEASRLRRMLLSIAHWLFGMTVFGMVAENDGFPALWQLAILFAVGMYTAEMGMQVVCNAAGILRDPRGAETRLKDATRT